MSYKPEILVEGEWCPNGIVFNTIEETLEYAKDLYTRWMMAEDFRAVPSTENVNYHYTLGTLTSLNLIGYTATIKE